MIIDTAPGIDHNVLYLNSAVENIQVIVTPDPSSLADSYALIKVLNSQYKEDRFSVICNQVQDEAEALQLFKRLSDVAEKFLCVSLNYTGFIPQDLILRRATKSQQLVVKSNPGAPSAQAFRDIAKKYVSNQPVGNLKGGMQFFWEQLIVPKAVGE